MNWDRVEGQWKQRRGKATHQWGKVMNDELAAIAGKYEDVVGRLQERYGIATEAAKAKVVEFKKMVEQLKKSNARLIQMQKSLQSKRMSDKKDLGKRKPARRLARSRSGA